MAIKVARRAVIPPFIVMDVMQAAAEREATGADVLHLEVGQPSTPAPAKVRQRAKALLDDDRLGYTVARGLPELRAAIAGHYGTAYRVAVPESRVFATTGSSGAFVLAFLAAFEPGDRVGITAPGYPCYRHILNAIGVEPVIVPVGPETRFQPTVEALETLDGPALDGLIVASPSNPAGAMLSPDELRRLCAWCDAGGVRLISDEIYHGISYGMEAQTAAAYSTSAVVINSFSKYFSMTGWRLGWMVVPDDLARPIECLAQNLFISPPTLSQHAAVAAFECLEELDGHVARYARNRELLLNELPGAGFGDMAPPDGAFYVYADVSHRTDDAQAFCTRMLEETGVATTPGVDFDAEAGRHFVRFSYAGSTEDMAEAMGRLKAWGG